MTSRNFINMSDDALKLLIYINDNIYAEYCDTEFLSVSVFEKSSSCGFMTVDEFKNRNCGGTFYLIMELLKYKLVEFYHNGYCSAYRLSSLGKNVTSNIVRKVKLEKLEKL